MGPMASRKGVIGRGDRESMGLEVHLLLNLPRFAQIVDCQMHLHHVYVQVLDFKRFGMPTLMASL